MRFLCLSVLLICSCTQKSDLNFLSEGDVRRLCKAEIVSTERTAATIKIVDWDYKARTINLDRAISDAQGRIEAAAKRDCSPAPICLDELSGRERLENLEAARKIGVEPINHYVKFSFDALNENGVPIRTDARCSVEDVGDKSLVSLDLSKSQRR